MQHVKFYFSIFLRRLHYFLIVAFIVSAAGLAVARMLPSVYQANVLVLVEKPQIPQELASSTVQTTAAESVNIIQRRLTTRAAILDIVDEMNIYPDRAALSPDEIINDMRRRIRISPLRAERGTAATVTVGFQGANPAQTAAVANELVTRLLEQNVELRTGSATQTLEFFEQEVARLSEELDVKSNRILEFQLANQNALPDGLEFRRAQQTNKQQSLTDVERQIADLTDRRANLVDLYERTGRVSLQPEDLSPAQRRLQQLESELESALLVYSESNPRVRLLQSRIVQAEAEVTAQQGSQSDEGPSLFDIQLADIDQQIEALQARKATLEQELADLRAANEATPQNGIRLAEMQRDRELTQSQYQSATRNLATAEMGERIEVLAKGQRMTVIEPAIVPNAPISPDRMLISAASVGGGVLLGLAVVVLLELTNSAIRRPATIVNKLGITPLAVLPYARTGRQVVVKRAAIFGVMAIVLIGVPATVWALHTYYLPLDLLIARVLDKVGLGALLETMRG